MIHFSVWQRWFIRMFDKENEVVNWRKTSDEIWLEETFFYKTILIYNKSFSL